MKRRDPRIDPQVGDVLVHRVAVTNVKPMPAMGDGMWVMYAETNGMFIAVLLEQWRKWARGARVEKQA